VTIEAWRICKAKYVQTAFDGEGAAREPGRWNQRGQKVVYTADSKALAVLEIVVHADAGLAAYYLLIPCSLDASLVEVLDPSTLPLKWSSLVDPSWAILQRLGGEWIASKRSAVLRVPTAVVPEQYNYLLNPEHPDFSKIQVGAAIDFEPDARLLRGPH
jgi:RES domain-containing protein